ncbi:amino acid racemase [bacterium]|nr:amino acid racemase [bacterium]
MRPLTIGVIGGMGPAATFDFCARLTALAPAARDQDHPRILVDCDPSIPDRNAAARGDGPQPGPVLAAKAADLQAAGAELIVMPCNAAHAYARDIQAAISIPFLDMIDATVRAARSGGARKIGVLAADGARQARLYETALTRSSAAPVLLSTEDQAAFMAVVYAIKSGDIGPAVRASMQSSARTLLASGAETIVSGCTEVPLALSESDISAPLISCTDELARATLARAYRDTGATPRANP